MSISLERPSIRTGSEGDGNRYVVGDRNGDNDGDGNECGDGGHHPLFAGGK